MKKKIIITLAILLVVILTSAAGFAVATGAFDKKEKPSDYKVGIPYEQIKKKNRPIIKSEFLTNRLLKATSLWLRFSMLTGAAIA